MVWDLSNPRVYGLVLTVLLVIGALAGCGEHPLASTDPNRLQHFFANANRRDPTFQESMGIVRLKGCSGFYVANTSNRVLVMTARHCLGMQPTAVEDWCAARGSVRDTNTDTIGTCAKVIAASVSYDLILLEMQFLDAFRPMATLRLAEFVPPAKTQLYMIGYPSDKFRQSQLTLTTNCWVTTSGLEMSPHSDLADPAGRHNCTTYGGNSGGPMIARNTDIVIGLPFTYRRGDFMHYRAEDLRNSAYFAAMSEFVSRHEHELRDAGVVTAATLND